MSTITHTDSSDVARSERNGVLFRLLFSAIFKTIYESPRDLHRLLRCLFPSPFPPKLGRRAAAKPPTAHAAGPLPRAPAAGWPHFSRSERAPRDRARLSAAASRAPFISPALRPRDPSPSRSRARTRPAGSSRAASRRAWLMRRGSSTTC